ncbi:hypothetical protein MM221_21155 [Salipaludibacillus sp. LMS25]|jgi:hypothetical protein|uniref:hypothetical protein n=1 Tax=Salipaludibacillus sp. LMS25 TaxID=2924031 RepID=UPI0020D0D611|nr:hypothetical protein [Salipaludibacillus sp. LMS25]UTR15004.1 hypothetical protein MM221_21155 [Salipaludibacillus sp. LMS25]
MIKFQYSDGNNNSDFIKGLISNISTEQNNIYWAIGDLDIIPRYSGDYPGSGNHKKQEIAWEFGEKVESEKVVFLEGATLYEVLDDTQTIRRGVFVCFFNNYSNDYNFRPKVEVTEVNTIQHSLSYLEIRILDGDMVFILTEDSKMISILENEYLEFLLD